MTSVAKTLATLEIDLANACVAAYSLIADAPLPVPTVVIPPSGVAPVLDCGNLLVVNCTQVTSAFQGPPEACAIVMQANLAVTVTRCIVNLTDFGKPAGRTELTDDGLGLADDVSTLFYGVTAACRAGTLWSGFAELSCADTSFRAFRPGASGGIGWFTWDIVVNVTAPLVDVSDDDWILWQSGEPILWQSSEPIVWET